MGSTDSGDEKSIVPIEDLFKEGSLRDMTIAELAIEYLGPVIKQLPSKSVRTGLGKIESTGGNYQGAIRTLGKLKTKNAVVTNQLQVTGDALVNDLLVVKSRTFIAGSTEVRSNAVFGGKTELAGRVHVGENIISSRSLLLSGEVEVNGRIIADGDITTKHKVVVTKIQTIGHLRSKGTLVVHEGIQAESISLLDPECQIYGDLMGSKIGIGQQRVLQRYIKNYDAGSSFSNPIRFIRYLFNTTRSAAKGTKAKGKRTIIEGDISAEDLFIENCIVTGSLNANRIIIGDNVEIHGEIHYSESFESLSGKDYPAIKIQEQELQYLPLEG